MILEGSLVTTVVGSPLTLGVFLLTLEESPLTVVAFRWTLAEVPFGKNLGTQEYFF